MIELRTYQNEAVNATINALSKKDNALVVAPTGAGKTVIVSAILNALLKETKKTALVLVHRKEIHVQNKNTMHNMYPTFSVSEFISGNKNTGGQIVYGMMLTVAHEMNLKTLPAFDYIFVDETHHIAAESYQKIIEHLKEKNENTKLIGVTATPARGDKMGLTCFDCVDFKISIDELITLGHLVKDKTYVLDSGADLTKIKKIGGEFSSKETENRVNKPPVNLRVFDEWVNKASKKQTIIFCVTKAHAASLCNVFINGGIDAAVISDSTPKKERALLVVKFKSRSVQVLLCVQTLTEGFDAPNIECVVLAKPTAQKTTMVQMIGRGLRPFENKTECIVLDFGQSILVHQNLNIDADLESKKSKKKSEAEEDIEVVCPECKLYNSTRATDCLGCGVTLKKVREIDYLDSGMLAGKSISLASDCKVLSEDELKEDMRFFLFS